MLGAFLESISTGLVTDTDMCRCFFGAIIAFVIGDYLGRKKTVLLGATIMSIGAITTADHMLWCTPNHHWTVRSLALLHSVKLG